MATVRWLRSRPRRRALILGYHRVGETVDDPYRLAVSPDVFRAHLEAVRGLGRGVSLSELLTGLEVGQVPPGSVAITFDDACSGTMAAIEPILRAYGIPATVFVPTAYLGRELWWDRLHRILSCPTPLPRVLELGTMAGGFRRALEESERSGPSPASRARLVRDVYDALLALSAAELESALREVEAWAGGPAGAPHDRVVCAEELVDLHAAELIEIGSHSATHPFLAELPVSEQREELGASKACLEELLGEEVTLLSYPNGSHSRASRDLARELGYRGACASRHDVVTSSSDPLSLPRFWPGNDPGAVSATLHRWLAA